jgi:hypothetical protein
VRQYRIDSGGGSRLNHPCIQISQNMPASALDQVASFRDGRRQMEEVGPGLIASLLLHGLAALLLLYFMQSAMRAPQNTPRILPIDLVQLGEETISPPAAQRALVPQQLSAARQLAKPTPTGTAPRKTKPFEDELEVRLKALSKLRQPDAKLAPLDNTGESDLTAASEGVPGSEAAYSVKDFIRAQVERRWSLDLGMLGSRNFAVAIHIALNGRGIVTKSEIVDVKRYKVDIAYREVALSARNAVLLSSPIKLPPGRFADGLDFILMLNPRDTLR